MEGSNEIRSDIENQHDHLRTLKRQELDRLSALFPSRCIYKVHKRLREVNEKAYTPQVVSIGPLHHDDEHLKAMEQNKMIYVQEFLHRNEASLQSCMQIVEAQEEELRNCYAEHIAIERDDFVRLVAVDALFLIEFLSRRASKELQSKDNDNIFGTPAIQRDLWSDLVMLENQLPFFILEDLWEGAVRRPDLRPILFQAYCSFWFQIYSKEVDLQALRMLSYTSEVKHFVDLIRNFCLPRAIKSSGKCKSIPSMTQLHKIGVKFKVRSTHDLLDIHFANGVLEIPKLKISDYTEATIRNLVAYEQCHYFKEAYISDYVVLMDGLVNTPEDVELLRKYEILNNMLGDSNQVSTLINNLGKGVIADYNNFYFATICEGLNEYCKKDWPKWKVNLRRNYLNTPWAVISVAAGIFLLVLTVIQTICSIISIA